MMVESALILSFLEVFVKVSLTCESRVILLNVSFQLIYVHTGVRYDFERNFRS